MKKLLFVFALLVSLPIFGQIEPKFEHQINVDEDGKYFFSKVNIEQFLFISSMKSPKDKNKIQWKISCFKDDLNLEWDKIFNLEKALLFNEAFELNGDFFIVFIEDIMSSGLKPYYKIVKIDSDGLVTIKEIDYKIIASIFGFYVNNDGLFYIEVTRKNSTPIFKMKMIDTKTMDITSISILDGSLPKYFVVPNIRFHNNILYLRIKEQHLMEGEKEGDFDKFIMLEKEKKIAEIPLTKNKNTYIDQTHMLESDSTHLFFFGISRKWTKGSKTNVQNYDYRLFLTPLKKEETEATNTLDVSFYNQLAEKRDIKAKNAPKLQVTKVYGNGYVINNTFRMNNKNYLVFDKYQEMINATRTSDGETTVFYFTNSVIYCFDDNGEIIWSNNVDYSIYSTSIYKCTYAAPIDNQTIGLTGLFNGKYSTIKISSETGKVTNNENIETNPIFDYDINYPLSEKIRPLSNTTFMTLVHVFETKEQQKKRRKNQNFNFPVDFKVYKIQ